MTDHRSKSNIQKRKLPTGLHARFIYAATHGYDPLKFELCICHQNHIKFT